MTKNAYRARKMIITLTVSFLSICLTSAQLFSADSRHEDPAYEKMKAQIKKEIYQQVRQELNVEVRAIV
jgi:hypothetical protein